MKKKFFVKISMYADLDKLFGKDFTKEELIKQCIDCYSSGELFAEFETEILDYEGFEYFRTYINYDNKKLKYS